MKQFFVILASVLFFQIANAKSVSVSCPEITAGPYTCQESRVDSFGSQSSPIQATINANLTKITPKPDSKGVVGSDYLNIKSANAADMDQRHNILNENAHCQNGSGAIDLVNPTTHSTFTFKADANSISQDTNEVDSQNKPVDTVSLQFSKKSAKSFSLRTVKTDYATFPGRPAVHDTTYECSLKQ